MQHQQQRTQVSVICTILLFHDLFTCGMQEKFVLLWGNLSPNWKVEKRFIFLLFLIVGVSTFGFLRSCGKWLEWRKYFLSMAPWLDLLRLAHCRIYGAHHLSLKLDDKEGVLAEQVHLYQHLHESLWGVISLRRTPHHSVKFKSALNGLLALLVQNQCE